MTGAEPAVGSDPGAARRVATISRSVDTRRCPGPYDLSARPADLRPSHRGHRSSSETPPQVDGRQRDHVLDAWLQAVGHGDARSFDHLYGRVAGLVLGLARRVLQDHAQAEEVAQEVLLEVWRTAWRYDPARASARTWILVITHRRAVDRVRSVERAALRDHRSLEAGLAASNDRDIGDEAERAQQRRVVQRALQGLTHLQREAVVLAYFHGRTYSEVSQELGVPLGTIKSRIRDGLRCLRTTLVDER